MGVTLARMAKALNENRYEDAMIERDRIHAVYSSINGELLHAVTILGLLISVGLLGLWRG